MHDDPRIAEEAAGWVAKLSSSDATAADREAFAVWLAQSPAHAAAYNDLKAIWDDAGQLTKARKSSAKGRPSAATRGATVAVLLLATAVVAGYSGGYVDRWRADAYSVVGEVKKVALADGSVAYLNTNSAIAFRFTPTERNVELLRGEAFFDVAKDADRPFIVKNGAIAVRAVGTRFMVSAVDAEEQVGVEEGKVEVSNKGGRALAEAGDAVRDDAGRLDVFKVDIGRITSWRGGKLVFSDQPLARVLAQLERYRIGRIFLMDKTLAGRRVSGVFDIADTDEALGVIEQSLPVVVTRVTPLIVVVRAR